ncbi:MBL fold metallo-hydrolase [Flavobacterium sp. '19STA2R22 D10 B1']|uniref:MBL fold metallo-hydrolase n=1 Tax=Flavobacterium aerium TaxID=3037261 RepID=UPI00278BAE8A|nr:MBL fold metallo-hydrolase [Flavobacterium sp. '19STA2R22 D10 B1']
MTHLHHLNCVKIVSPINDNVIGHCILIEDKNGLALIDTGIGLLDIEQPNERIGKELIDIVGYHFDEGSTAIRQIEKLGLNPNNVTDCIISHLDNDHIGGLADFPKVKVHVGAEEYENFNSGNPRYLKQPLSHQPTVKTYSKSTEKWFGFEARKVETNLKTEIYLIPLPGHTLGHCGVAIKDGQNWLFYIGDAYYMRIELTDTNHPVNQLATMRADDNTLRLETLDRIREFINQHPEIEVFGYHDLEEFNHFEQNQVFSTL